MSDQESERPGGTLPGLKKSDLLTRQTGDGSFEFIVESDASSEGYDYEAEPGVSPAAESHLPVGARNQKSAFLIGAAIVVVMVLIGAGFAFSKMGDKPADRGAEVVDQEVAGFRPYGGGEAVVRDAKPAAPARRARVNPVVPAPAPVEEPPEQFVQETYEEEMPSNVVPEQEAEWQVGENEQIREEEELPAAPMRALTRDRMNLKQVQLLNKDSERIRTVTGREDLRRRGSSRQLDRIRRSQQVEESVQETFEEELPYDEEESPVLEEESFEESGSEEEYYEDEEELEEEIY